MSFSAYEITVPVMMHGLTTLMDYLDHAQKLEETKGLQPGEMLNARLAPDMLTFGQQLSITTNKVFHHVTQLKREDPPSPVETEQSYAALRARIGETRLFLQDVKPEQLNGVESHPFNLNPIIIRGWFGGTDYILYLVMPDFFFHITTAHDILRHHGAPIGKRDYLGRLNIEYHGSDYS